jgi:hypothetical protein
MVNLDCQPDWIEKHLEEKHTSGWDCEGVSREDSIRKAQKLFNPLIDSKFEWTIRSWWNWRR